MRSNDDLLQPSLERSGSARSIYSSTVGYLSGFIGGPVAAVIVAMVNSHRLGRLGMDWYLAVLGLALAVLVLAPAPWGFALQMADSFGASGARIAYRIAGLAVFGVFYLVHARYHRNMEIVGIKAPSGWILGIVATLAGVLSAVLLSALGQS